MMNLGVNPGLTSLLVNPQVTCLCLTRNRREWLPKAIACFQDQTYENRRLLIVADGDDVQDLIPYDTRISLLVVEEGLTIGEKRNRGCIYAREADIIAHWDDDDHSAPGRLEDQVSRLLEANKAVTGYHTLRFTDGQLWWEHANPTSWAFGTSLCYLRTFWTYCNMFPSLQVGEDADFVRKAVRYRELITAPARGLMYATNHPGNTSVRVIGEGWRRVAALTEASA